MAAPCPRCGFDPTGLSPGDAVVAIRSFPRRFAAFALPPPGEPGETPGPVEGAPEFEPPSDETAREIRRAVGLAAAGRAAGAIAVLVADLRAVLVHDNPVLAPDAATEDRDPGDPATALDRLAAVCDELASLAHSQPGSAWTRTGSRPAGPVAAGELLREAVHAGVHQLRLAEQAA